MPITITERPDSRTSEEGERKSQDRRYNVLGTHDQAAAQAALAAAAPASLDGLARLGVRVEPRYVNEDDEDRCLWLGIAEYGVPSSQAIEPLEVGDVVVSVNTIGGTEHVTAPLTRIGSYPDPGAPTARGIGDNGQGEVEGVDIYVSALELEVTKVFASAAAAPSPAVLDNFGVVTNAAEFTVTDTKTGRSRTFAIGTLLYLGHREGRARTDGALEITCQFWGRKVRPELVIGAITVPASEPWSYLWLRWEQTEDGDAHKLYAEAIGAYVDRNYGSGDFEALDLGPPA
jgi:hypothetical protein